MLFLSKIRGPKQEELIQYLYYYNHERPHQGINGDTPIDFRNKLLPN
ncbi:MAG: IS3 family transposase [Candidatus Methylomirabilales bacterium]